jgi:thymidylate synthase ThyX
MTISAKVIADSLNAQGVRVTTLQLLYPRFIHAEFMTHRVFSRNASSSRAIPVTKIINAIINDPALPVSWGQNQKGMQADQDVDAATAARAKAVWLKGAEAAVVTAEALIELGIHKQIANRVLEPWAHISVIVTATEWENFYALRDHKDAQPEIAALARAMRVAMDESTPRLLGPNDWHLPYVTDEDRRLVGIFAETLWGHNTDQCHRQFDGVADLREYMLLQVSTARCARVSYNTHDGGKPKIEDDIKLADRLLASKHMSPFEHQVTPCGCGQFHANMRGFHTFRGILETTERLRAHAALAQRRVVEELRRMGFEVVGEAPVQ